jgi:hypothetical protein
MIAGIPGTIIAGGMPTILAADGTTGDGLYPMLVK